MGIFEKRKIHFLKKKIDLIKENAHNKGKFSLFDAKFAEDIFNKNTNYDYLNSMYDILKSWEDSCNLPYNIGISLDRMTSDNVVMFHRTNLGLDREKSGLEYDENLLSIMRDGLKNFGHLGSGGASNDNRIPLDLTMTPLNGITGYINLVGSYKSNDVIILAVFPKKFVKDDGEVVNESNYSDIYDLDDITPKVKKEYMLGVILKKDNGLDEFYTRDEVISAFANKKQNYL